MPKLLHVTAVTHTLHFLIGQIKFMQSAGLDVETVSSVDPNGDAKLDFFLEHENVAHTPIQISRALTPIRDLISAWKLWKHLRKTRPEIIHAHTPKAGLVTMLAGSIARVPIRVYHIHGLRFSTLTGWKRVLVIAAEKLTCQLATRVLCVSPSARDEAIRCRLCHSDRIQVLRSGSINGLDAAVRFNPDNVETDLRETIRKRLGIRDEDVVIGFIGRLAKDKGIEELVAAFQSVQNTAQRSDGNLERRIRLVLVGDHEMQDPISEHTRNIIQHNPMIHRLDYDPETPKLYAAMDIFCLPSYREGLPYVALEAAAMRLPVITTNATGCVDGVEDGVTGTCVSVANSKALAAAIRRYADDRGLRLWHGNAGRRRVLQDFVPADIWQATLDEYHSELARLDLPLPKPIQEERMATVRKSAA